MKIQDLKDGRRYILMRDVKNPMLDRRERYSPSQLAWSNGDIFRASVRNATHLDAVLIAATPRRPIGGVHEHHQGFAALVDALQEIPESPADVCARLYVEPKHALRKLYEMGKITLADVEAACIEESKEDEAPPESAPLARLRHHVTGAIERGEAVPIVEQRDEKPKK